MMKISPVWIRRGKCPPKNHRVVKRLFENLADPARDRLGAFARHLLSERCQLLDLFVQRLELLSACDVHSSTISDSDFAVAS
jgi:hypothetical protein